MNHAFESAACAWCHNAGHALAEDIGDLPAAGHPFGVRRPTRARSRRSGRPGRDSSPALPEGVRTFLIADIRGYTTFTQDRGDEVAAALAAKFAALAREAVEARAGHLLELRGDEALAVFASPRQAIRAAVDLQRRLVRETLEDAALPLPAGIGLDAGEAVAVEGGYRGSALNVAARLCSLAGPGEIIASLEVAHLARKVEGADFVELSPVRLKGLDRPVQGVRVVPEGEDPATAMKRYAVPSSAQPGRSAAMRRLRSPRIVIAVALGLTLAIGGLAALALRPNLPPAVAVQDDSLSFVDLRSGRVTQTLPVGPQPGAVIADGATLWVADVGNGAVVHVDPARGTIVETIKTGFEPTDMALGAGSLWVVVDRSRSVMRINPTTQSVVGSIEVGNGPRGIALGKGAVWVTDSLDDTVVRIDQSSGRLTNVFPASGTPIGIAVGDGAVWVADSTEGAVTRLDPATGRQVARIQVGNGPQSVAVGAGAVWVTNSLDGTVSRIDPSTNSVSATIPAGQEAAGLAVTADAVWVANEQGGSLTEIDPRNATVERTVALGHAAEAVTVADGGVWASVRQSPTDHRGGTLTAVSTHDFLGSIDPAFASSPAVYIVLSLTNDGLVAYKRTGGTDGNTLVPDLAVAIPAPTDGGLAYTFTLRPGPRYSTGQPVRASDVRASLERVFKTKSPAGTEYGAIEGAGSCLKSPSTCDLSSGIEVDDTAGTVTFHLSRPDPDFLFELADLPAVVLPAGLPATGQATTPLPATGPYVIKSYAPGKLLELDRNPSFGESSTRRPAGYVDRIVWQMGIQTSDLATEILQGKADYIMLERLSADERSTFETVHTELLHQYLRPATFHFFLNTRVAPFNDVRVRQAVNYAMDRRAALAAYPDPGTVTCQVLPPSFPGYEPYCPYTIDPSSAGAWTAPDLAKARALVAASGTAGRAVTVWELPPFAATGKVFVDTLDALGYRATLKVQPAEGFFVRVWDSTKAVQAAGYWVAPNIASGDGFLGYFSCSAFIKANGGQNQNDAEFCDTGVDALIKQAQQLQVADPAAAGAEWALVDRAITDRAPWVSVLVPGVSDYISARVGDYQANNSVGILLDEVWVR